MNHSKILTHYATCALWSSTDHNDEPLDSIYDLDDISSVTWGQMAFDVLAFMQANGKLLVESGQSDEQIGHDFWLTRNGHGAGFWDRGLGTVGDELTNSANAFGSVDLYVGDDGRVHSA